MLMPAQSKVQRSTQEKVLICLVHAFEFSVTTAHFWACPACDVAGCTAAHLRMRSENGARLAVKRLKILRATEAEAAPMVSTLCTHCSGGSSTHHSGSCAFVLQ